MKPSVVPSQNINRSIAERHPRPLTEPLRFESLQVYRGLAALMVVFFHATTLTERRFGWSFARGLFSFGNSGVDFFFVLSGFIIFFVHRQELGGRSHVVRYFYKRVTRVVPTYWFWTLVSVVAFMVFTNLGEGFERTPRGIFTSLFFVPQPHGPIVRAGWSLNFEMWFYVLFGAALWAGRRAARAAVVVWAAILIYGNLVYGHGALENQNVAMEFLLNPLQLEFILGVFAAALVVRWPLTSRYALLSATVGWILFIWGATHASLTFAWFGRFYNVMTLGVPALLVIYSSVYLERFWRWPRALVSLGDASYSIYLSHGLVMAAVARLVAMTSNLRVLADIGVAVALGYVAYILFERPLLRFTRKNQDHGDC